MSDELSRFLPEASQAWEKAVHRAAIENVLALVTHRNHELLPFAEVAKRLHLQQGSYRGLHNISLEQIRGSVGRYRDFTAHFSPRNQELRDRWRRVYTLAYYKGFPPIEAYEVGEAYFVVDGNHRVSVARALNYETIEAYVWQYDGLVGLSAQADWEEVLIKEEYVEFLEYTRLRDFHGFEEITLTRPGGYREFLHQIELLIQVEQENTGTILSFPDAAVQWYIRIYQRAIALIQEHGLLRDFPDLTEGDFLVWVWRLYKERQYELTDEHFLLAANEVIAEAKPPLWKRWLKHLKEIIQR